MADFIMTMSSDDERPSKPAASTSKPAPPKKSKQPTAGGASKLTRKQQLEAAKKARKQKRKAVDEADDLAEDSDEPVESGEEEVGGMAADFHFDGLGGGFVGDRRNNVWDAGFDYATKKHANPRLTVDQIIARRAPERDAKAKARAKRAAGEVDDEDEEDDDSADELELEMMSDLEAELSGDDDDEDEELELDEDEEDDIERPEGAKADGSDDEEEGDDSEEDDEEAAKAKKEPVEVDDGEDWLRLGEKSSGEEESEGEESGDEAAVDDAEIATGFAALADVDDEASASDDDTPLDLKPSATSKADDAIDAAEAAAAKAYFTAHSNSTASSTATSFGTIPNANLSRQLLLALGSLNLTKPTPIQRECIPVAMMGKDIVASSATGSGKTVAFWVGVLERLLHRDRRNPTTRVVVMTPTRELAVQVHGVGVALARYTDIQFCLCVGGLSLKVQEAELKQRPDVVVSTPGRLIDHVRNTPCFSMDGVEILVLDEADRMLEEGFKAELEEIITAAPRSRQTLLFSATVTESIASLSRLSMNKPVRVKMDEMGAAAKGLIQEFLRVRGDKAGEAIERGFRSGERSREALLVALCTRSFASGRTIIFFRSKAQAHRMKIIFTLQGEGLEMSDELHGDLTQEQRLASLKRFREGESAFLLATDLASRGLDIKGIENVINYEMPKSIEIYLHRVGRTARAGKKGRALTLVGESDRKLVKLAMKHAPPESVKQRVIPPEVINEVSHELKELEGEVKAVQREEKEEKEFRKGDMELQKGRNMLEHEAEIMARPARTWFQTKQEKEIAKGLGLAEHNGKFAERGENKKRKAEEEAAASKKDKRDPFRGLSRREKRRKQAALEDKEDHDDGTYREINSAVRSAKKKALPARMTVVAPEREKGVTAKKPKKGGFFDREKFRAGEEGAGASRPRAAKKAGAGKIKGTGKAMGPKRR